MKQIVRKAALVGALGVGFGAAATVMDAVQEPILPAGAQVARVPEGATDLATAFREASKAALPAVVYVEVQAAPRNVSNRIPEQFRGTPFEQFFGDPEGMPARPQRGSGSGFIISPDGYIITNNHVVEDATQVTVTLTDKREFDARVVGRDPNTDVAVLKVEGNNLPTARFGDSSNLQIGDWVLALGYPMQLGETVTAGIVSAMGRSLGIIEKNEQSQNPLEHFIQTDAAINPGNSGGPLVNLRGEVVGINSAIASQTGTYTGYGFAVPVTLARRVAEDLMRDGVVHRPKLGVAIGPVSLADADVFRLPEPRGAVVRSVQEGPAADAGVRMGDVIVAVAGKPIQDPAELMEQVALKRPGETIPVDLVRYGDRKRVNVKLGAFEAAAVTRPEAAPASREPLSRLGFAATATQNGVVVSEIDPSSPANEAGISRGFRLEKINGKEIDSTSDVQDVADALRPGNTVSVIGRLPDGSQTIVNYRLRR